MSLDPAAIIKQIDELEAKRSAMCSRSKYDDLSDLPEAELAGLVSLQLHTIERFAPPGSTFRKASDAVFSQHQMDSPHFTQKHYAGILSSIRTAYAEQDYLASVQELIHADLFGDLLEMADHLLAEGYKDAAAVTGGGVLEEAIRKLADKNGVPIVDGTKPRKADTINADLVKAGVYNKLEQKNVTAWLGLRNDAAHANYSNYDKTQVQQFIEGIRQFLIRNPA